MDPSQQDHDCSEKAAAGMLVKLHLLIKFMAVMGKIVILTGLIEHVQVNSVNIALLMLKL